MAGTVENAKVATRSATRRVTRVAARMVKRPRVVTFPEGPLALFMRPRHGMV
jgi:hypothetical protein